MLIEGAGPQGPFYEYQDSGGETTYVTVAALNEYGELVPGVDVKVTATTLMDPDGTDGTVYCVVSLDPDPAVNNDEVDPDQRRPCCQGVPDGSVRHRPGRSYRPEPEPERRQLAAPGSRLPRV